MNREDISKSDLNNYKNLTRIFKVQNLYFDTKIYKEGNILTTKEAKSFAGENIFSKFEADSAIANENSIEIVFAVDGVVKAHKVNYNKAEVETLGAFKNEDEYLVPAGTHFVITFSSNEEDINEEGYFSVDIEQISDEKYNKLIKNGAKEYFDI